MAKYQQYAEYKNSGVEWLGEIPSHWQLRRIQESANIINGYPFESSKFNPTKGTPLVRIRDIRNQKAEVCFDGFVPEVAVINNGDILIGMDGDFNVAKWAGGKAALNQRVACVRHENSITQSFLYYLLPFHMKIVNDLTYYTTVKHLSSNDILKTTFALPSEAELKSIVSFLDHETAQIDSLIEKQQTLIQLLKEKRQAVISHAVTKGLNPDAPMKDSGVEWLGEVPEHWDVMQFRRITSLSQGLQIPQSERIHEPSKNNVEYITIKSIHAGDTLEHREYINKPSLRVQCDYDDVLLARTGATGEVITGVKGAFHNNFFKIDYSEKIDKNFLVNMLKVQELKSHLLMLAGTTTIPDLNHGAFLSTAIALPSLEEQEEICSEISRLSEKYNLLLEVAIKQVKLLQERRTALISAAVTGKIDVRGWRASE
ncbi:restriction endonuclease subunit S [uncultured Psychrobacter sp.]|uniref:restriction endonuclease subunit S n=1 Tax=uncultured Psychrobacter sp. TaxID=259303 RepID=UPI002622872F|nr:restriction endonuclease subunit S [uncultured Psychrobacter sp.]